MQGRGVATISALIVDDESLARDELEYLLSAFPDVEVCGTASDGIEALEKIDAAEPDIVFLDVQMPGLDGLSVIKQVRERGGHQPYFILATAYDQYAVEAFQLEALDYVLKPVEKDRLALSVGRAQKWLQERAVKNPPPSLELNVPQRAPALQRTKVLVRAQGRNFIVDANEIIYATIDNGLITVVASNLEGISNYRTIEELQSNLDPEVFWRVHRSYLVNINRIREVIPWFKSSYQLKMDDKKQTEIPVSRVQTKKLRALLKL